MIYLSDSIRPMRHICTLNMPQWQKYAVPVDLLVEAKKCLNHHFCRVGIFVRWHTLCSAHSYHPCWQKFATIKCVGGKIWGHWQIRLYSARMLLSIRVRCYKVNKRRGTQIIIIAITASKGESWWRDAKNHFPYPNLKHHRGKDQYLNHPAQKKYPNCYWTG